MPSPAVRLARAVALSLSALGMTATLAACSAPLVVEPAPYAADPRCASIMLGIPEEVGGLSLRATSSQATAAYGDEAIIVVRCGVEPPGPSNERCVAVETSGAAQSWLVTETEDAWVAVAFGRTPALEVTIPKARADQAVGEILGQFGESAVLADPNGLECR